MIDDIELIRIKRGTQKVCRCLGCGFLVDTDCRKVFCQECGAEVDPFVAMFRMVTSGQRYLDSRKHLIQEVAELEKKRRRTTLFRDLERHYLAPNGGSKMYPICPNCGDTFHFERIGGWSIQTSQKKEVSHEV